jgi:hypothetical protein
VNWGALSLPEAAALWLASAGVALWLYTRHRRWAHLRVSTLRFWASASIKTQRRRRLAERAAFVAQLFFLLLLILALADPRTSRTQPGRSIVLILDTSLWAQVQPQGEPSWMDLERREALGYLASVPAEDRVLLLRADADATPVVPFTTDRAVLRQAVLNLQPTSTVADLPRALELGRAALSGSRRGLLLYVGPGMVPEEDASQLRAIRGLESDQGDQFEMKVRLVGRDKPIQNVGIIGLGLRRDPRNPELCHLMSTVRNYGSTATTVNLRIFQDGGSSVQQAVSIAGGGVIRAYTDFVSTRAGTIEASIRPSDALAADNQAVLAVPALRRVRVAVFAEDSDFAREMQKVFAADPEIATEVLRPGATPAKPADIRILLAKSQPAQPLGNSIVFLDGSAPRPARLTGWNPEHPVTEWVHTQDLTVRNWTALRPEPADTVLATESGSPDVPLILAREQPGQKTLVMGFDPRRSNLSKLSAFPLLMAGAVEWMVAPPQAVIASAVPGNLYVPGAADKVVDHASNVPFLPSAQGVQFFAATTGLYHLVRGNGDRIVAVNAPPLPMQRWEPSADELDFGPVAVRQPLSDSWWKWLVLLAVLALWVEWRLFYSRDRREEPLWKRVIQLE